MDTLVHRIRINNNNIQILSNFDAGKVIFTVWLDDFDKFREAFAKCERYNKELEELRKKYEG